jgi:hypothetical protein
MKPTYEQLLELVQELSLALDDAVDFMGTFESTGCEVESFGCTCGYEDGEDGIEECQCMQDDTHIRVGEKRQVLDKVEAILGRNE